MAQNETHGSHFCNKFNENNQKIDYVFNTGIGSDSKVIIVIGHHSWSIDVNPEDLSVQFLSNQSSINDDLKLYRMGFNGGADIVGFIPKVVNHLFLKNN